MYRKKHGEKLKPWDIRIQIDGKKLGPTTHIKYLYILIDSHLNWNVDDLSSVRMLAKIRHYVNKKHLT